VRPFPIECEYIERAYSSAASTQRVFIECVYVYRALLCECRALLSLFRTLLCKCKAPCHAVACRV